MADNLSEKINQIIKKHYDEIQDEISKAIESNELIIQDSLIGWNDLNRLSHRSEHFVEVDINGLKTTYTIALELLFHDKRRIHRSLEEALLKDDGMSRPIEY